MQSKHNIVQYKCFCPEGIVVLGEWNLNWCVLAFSFYVLMLRVSIHIGDKINNNMQLENVRSYVYIFLYVCVCVYIAYVWITGRKIGYKYRWSTTDLTNDKLRVLQYSVTNVNFIIFKIISNIFIYLWCSDWCNIVYTRNYFCL